MQSKKLQYSLNRRYEEKCKKLVLNFRFFFFIECVQIDERSNCVYFHDEEKIYQIF